MKTQRVALALLVALTPCAFAAPAAAQSGAEDATTAMARARFKEGVEFYDKGEYEQARASFLQAYALKKHPAVLLNLAWSCVKSGHVLEGKKYFEQFLADGKEITDKQRADANDGLNQARGKLGRIDIQATAGTEVTVDGEKVGTAPLSDPVSVEAGAHTVKFKGPDGSTDTQSVSVLGGQKAVAKFPQGGTPPAPAPVPTPPASTGGGSSTPPPDTSSPPPSTASNPPDENNSSPPPSHGHVKDETTSSNGGFFTPPNNVVPALVLGGVSVAGFVTAIIMGVSKSTAQDNANQIAARISVVSPGNPQGDPGDYANYNSDLNDVNTDATIANIGLGVGIAGLAGAVLYWGLADKGHGSAALHAPIVTPMIGRSSGGASLGLSF
jgi:hypothetical protein